jgi:hypothetical protein
MNEQATDLIEVADDDYDCAATDTNWRFGLYLDPEARRVSHWSMYGSGTPMPVWHGRALVIGLPYGAVGSAVREIVESDECRALLTALCDSYRGSEWDGSNHVGRWQGEGDGTDRHEKEEAIEALFREVPTYWSASEYLSPVWGQDEADSVRERLRKGETMDDIVNDMVEDALRIDVHLDADDMLSTLESLLAEHPVECSCGCCGCDEPATDTDEGGNPSCAACLTYLSLDDGTLVCSRQTEDFSKCHECYEDISWTGILTGTPGQSNYRLGDCGCGKDVWRNEEIGGGWDRYGYAPGEDEDEAVG